MALQHFYSRVPARMSIYNRTDGFDTFAFSSGIENEFIQKELAAVYDNKPSKNDASLIRTGKLNPVYCQYFTKGDILVQGCISYLPLDYTGERSAYFSQILLPDKTEEKSILASLDNAAFNPDMFKASIDDFNLTDESAKPDTNYPAISYEPLASSGTETLLKYDSAMMKRLIFAMLNLACGKGKNIFVSMPYDMEDFSKKSLNFMNSVLQIFPFHLRRAFSFVTYTDDGTRYNGFNIKFIPEGVPEIPLSKGMTLHFGSKIAIGLSDEMVLSNNFLVEFFYNLIKSDSVRREFLSFIENAIEAEPMLKKINLKAVTELVFLFEQCSGLYDENTVLPNDTRIYEFICAYEKHRNALSKEYRAVALKCLERYPDNHLPIPKDVFQKLTRIYASETYESKRVIMGVVLELIHTDLMRDKLFSFVKSNYESEDTKMRSEISLNLCRVYYGGFLQPQILGFFEEAFKNETDETKNSIVDKLLLTIRTPSVKGKIIEFFDANYDSLTTKQKNRFYSTFFEMIPECDSLTSDLLKLANKHISNESAEFLSGVDVRLFDIAEADQRRKEPKLLKIMMNNPGYCTTAVIKKILCEHGDDEIFNTFVKSFKLLSNRARLKMLDDIWLSVPDIKPEIAEKWAKGLCLLQESEPDSYSLNELVEIDSRLSSLLNEDEAKKIFAKTVLEGFIRPLLCAALPEAFAPKLKKDALKAMIEYSADKPYITFAAEYKPIGDYIKLVSAASKQKYEEMILYTDSFMDKHIRAGAIEHINSDIVNSADFADEKYDLTKIVARLMISYINSKEFSFREIYSDYFTKICEKTAAEVNREDVENDAARKAIGYILKAAEILFMSKTFAEYRAIIVESGGELALSVSDFASKQKKARKWTDEYLTYNKFDKIFSDRVLAMYDGIKTSSGGFLSRIFKK